MSASEKMKYISQTCSVFLFLLLCASLTYWTLFFTTQPTHQVALSSVNEMPPVVLSDAMSLFGGSSNNESRFPLFLRGVILSGESDASLAIIGAPGLPQKLIQRDAELMPGITLHEIHANYIVVLDHGLRREVPLSSFSTAPPSFNTNITSLKESNRVEVLGQQPEGSRLAPIPQ
jgi:general secretion pathway protein C